MTSQHPTKRSQGPKQNRGDPRTSAKSHSANNRTTSNPKQVNRKSAGAAVSHGSSASVTGPTKVEDETVHVPILILGAQGCGKSSLINAALGEPVQEVSNGFELATKDFQSNTLNTGKHTFRLIDSPGFDNTLMNDAEIMTRLIRFLCCGTTPASMAGVIYVHTQESRLGSAVLKRNLYMIKSLLGDSFMDRLTILLVPRLGEQVNHKDIVQPLLDPKSPFYDLYNSGAQFDVSALETQSIRNLLLSFAGKTPTAMSVQTQLCRPDRVLTDDDIGTYLIACARGREGGSVVTRPKITSVGISRIIAASTPQGGSDDVKKLERALAASKKQTEGVSTQLQQHLDEYAALRSQLQIHENVEQRDIVQNLIDLNRRIEDISISLSQYLVDTYGNNITTTQQAFRLPELKGLFGHEEGKASLVLSSTGVGRSLEDFIDVATRSLLCEQVFKRIIAPFHPGLPSSDVRNEHVSAMYARIREEESQTTLGRWRTTSFTAISGLIGEPELSRLKSKVGADILNESLMPMLLYLFGPDTSARPRETHVKELMELATQAWDWCVILKEKIVLLGDFQPVSYRYGGDFDGTVMLEFEPRRRGQPPERILSTIGLGLNVFRAGSSGEGSDRVVLHKAPVITEGWFE